VAVYADAGPSSTLTLARALRWRWPELYAGAGPSSTLTLAPTVRLQGGQLGSVLRRRFFVRVANGPII